MNDVQNCLAWIGSEKCSPEAAKAPLSWLADDLERKIQTGQPFTFLMKYDGLKVYAEGNQDRIDFKAKNLQFPEGHASPEEFVDWLRSGHVPTRSEPSDEAHRIGKAIDLLFADLDEGMPKPVLLSYWAAIEILLGRMENELETRPFASAATNHSGYVLTKLHGFRDKLSKLCEVTDIEDGEWWRIHGQASSDLFLLPQHAD